MRESKKSEGGAFKAPPPPDRIGLNDGDIDMSLCLSFKLFIYKLKAYGFSFANFKPIRL